MEELASYMMGWVVFSVSANMQNKNSKMERRSWKEGTGNNRKEEKEGSRLNASKG